MGDPRTPRAPFAPWDRRELPGTFDVEETARRVGNYKWIEMRLFEVLGGWVATVPELEDWRDGEMLIQSLMRSPDDVRRAAERQGELEQLMFAAGGIAGPGSIGDSYVEASANGGSA